MNVYHLQVEIRDILARIDVEGEEISDALAAEISRLNIEVADRVNAFYRVIRTANTCAAAVRNEASYLAARARRWETVKENMKEHLHTLLRSLGTRCFETDLCRPTICKGPPVVEVESGFNIRDLEGGEYDFLLEKEVTLSSQKVKDYAKKGGQLPGGIKLSEGKDYLRIL